MGSRSMSITISPGRPITTLPSWLVNMKFTDYLEYVINLRDAALPMQVMEYVTGVHFTKRARTSPEWVVGYYIQNSRAREVVVYVKCGTIAMLRMDVAAARSARDV